MIPYFEQGGVSLYRGDCRDIIPALGIAPALTLTDPPYGVSERCDRKSKGRSNATESSDFAPVFGDDEPFDPSHLLGLGRLVLFGANYYAAHLPASPSWLVWDKKDGTTPDDNADCEVAWTNLGGPARIYRHLWRGMIKASERDERRIHPTQKPVALGAWVLRQHTQPGDLVLDPYAGSGAFLIAALRTGRRAIGIEISEDYCRAIAERLTRELAQGSLFPRGAA
jgi:site-specific DNA-methyltransferase (adenine-specific)